MSMPPTPHKDNLMSTIPANLFVNVDPSVLAAGGSALDLNGLVLTRNTRAPIGSVLSFASTALVQDFFGGTSHEASIAGTYFAGFDTSNVKPAAILFAQYPLDDVGAYLRGGNISGLTLTQLQALSGPLSVTIDSVVKSGTVALSGATSFTNAADIIADTLSIEGAQVAAFTGALAAGVMTVSAMTSGALAVGDTVDGAGVTPGTSILSFGTATGGVGTYNVQNSQTVSSEAMTAKAPAVNFDSVSGAFVISSATTGADSTVTFGTGMLATSLLLTAATGAVLSQGADATAPAAFMTALTQVTQNWATFMTAFDPDEGSGFAQKIAFAGWTSQQNNRYAYVCWDTDLSPTVSVPATASLGHAISEANYSGTALVWELGDQNLAAFVCGAAASIDFTQTNGRIAFAYKAQAGLSPGVTDAASAINLGGNPQLNGDRGNGYNYYGAIATANQQFINFQRGFVSGPFLWLDTYVNQIWLNSQLQLDLMTLETQVNSIPFNSAGDVLVEASLADTIQQAVAFGAIVAGVTLSSSQVAQVNAAAGKDIATTLFNQGWYVLIAPASPTVRQARGPRKLTLFYVDGESVQSFALGSVVLQ